MNKKTKEQKVIDNIKELLSEQTKNLDKAGKAKFLKTLGYNNFNEILELEYEQMFDLYEHIKSRKGLVYALDEESLKGYRISKPKEPRTVKDISFSIIGHKIQ